jgi:NADH dehydrogenase
MFDLEANMRQIIIVGGGFAGVWAALAAANARRLYGGTGDLAITLVSREPWLTIRPRLYDRTLDELRVRLDDVLAPAGVRRIEEEVTHVDSTARTIAIGRGAGARTLRYDRLVFAGGSHTHRPPIAGGELAMTLDSYADAVALERHLQSLPISEPSEARFGAVVIGAGFTGIEVATELATRIRAVAARSGVGHQGRVVVVERASVVAPDLGTDARRWVEAAFAELGIETRLGVGVRAIHQNGVLLDNAEWIPSATVVWTGGFRASELTAQFAADRDAAGRLSVDEYLGVSGIPGVLAAGDVARAIADQQGGHVAPMSCQFAIPMGDVAGHNAVAQLLGVSMRPFSPSTYVTCLDLGEAGALFMEGWDRAVRLTGSWGKVMKQAINTRLIYPPVMVLGTDKGLVAA